MTPKQLETHNLPTDDAENIKSTNKGRDLLLANKPRIVPWGTERTRKGSRGRARLLYLDQHMINERKTKWKNLAMALFDYKKIWYCSAKLDHKLPQNLQNIRWSHKLYRKNNKNLENGIDSRRKKLSWSKNPKRYISRRCSITITIYNCYDAI